MGLSLDLPAGRPRRSRSGSQTGGGWTVSGKTGDAGLTQPSLLSFFSRQHSDLVGPGDLEENVGAEKEAIVETAVSGKSVIANSGSAKDCHGDDDGMKGDWESEFNNPSSSDGAIEEGRGMKRKRLNDKENGYDVSISGVHGEEGGCGRADSRSGDRRVIGSRRKRVSLGDSAAGQHDTVVESGGRQKKHLVKMEDEQTEEQKHVLASLVRVSPTESSTASLQELSTTLLAASKGGDGVPGEKLTVTDVTEAVAAADVDVALSSHHTEVGRMFNSVSDSEGVRADPEGVREDPEEVKAHLEAEGEGFAGYGNGEKENAAHFSGALTHCEGKESTSLVLGPDGLYYGERQCINAGLSVEGSDDNQKTGDVRALASPVEKNIAAQLSLSNVQECNSESLDLKLTTKRASELGRVTLLDDKGSDDPESSPWRRVGDGRAIESRGEGISRERRCSAGEDEGLCEYERLRAQTIRRNRSVLEQLGLFEASMKVQDYSAKKNIPRKISKPRKSAGSVEPTMPLRRSLRMRGISAMPGVSDEANALANADSSSVQGDSNGQEEGKEEEERHIEYDDSSVLRYMCGSRVGCAEGFKAVTVVGVGGVEDSARSMPSDHEESGSGGEGEGVSFSGGGCAPKGVTTRSQRQIIELGRKVVGFRPTGKVLGDAPLSKVYCMDLWGGESSLLIAGGHGGRMAVFGIGDRKGGYRDEVDETEEREAFIDEVEPEKPLLSWKGSNGWVSCTQFLSRQDQDGSIFVLTGSNDRNMVLWDINKQVRGRKSDHGSCPRVVARTEKIHSQGIFAMDEFDCKVVSASKDKTVVCSSVSSARGFVKERVLSGHHSGPVRGVKFRDERVLADCSADGTVSVLDLRAPVACTISIEGAHQSGVNVVEWHPSMDNILMSASFDPHIYLHDIRSIAAPLFRLSGHVHPSLSRCKQIYRPTFVAGGKGIVSTGENSKLLSLYSTEIGKAISRGHLQCTGNMVMMGGANSSLRRPLGRDVNFERCLWVAGKEITPYSAVFALDELMQ